MAELSPMEAKQKAAMEAVRKAALAEGFVVDARLAAPKTDRSFYFPYNALVRIEPKPEAAWGQRSTFSAPRVQVRPVRALYPKLVFVFEVSSFHQHRYAPRTFNVGSVPAALPGIFLTLREMMQATRREHLAKLARERSAGTREAIVKRAGEKMRDFDCRALVQWGVTSTVFCAFIQHPRGSAIVVTYEVPPTMRTFRSCVRHAKGIARAVNKALDKR